MFAHGRAETLCRACVCRAEALVVDAADFRHEDTARYAVAEFGLHLAHCLGIKPLRFGAAPTAILYCGVQHLRFVFAEGELEFAALDEFDVHAGCLGEFGR